MAKNTSTIYLGYEDALITERHKNGIDFTTNKVGGHPNWSNSEITIPSCTICGIKRPLIMQIYAPLENSPFHRTFYIFACLNATCSTQAKGWHCIRTQQMQKLNDRDIQNINHSNFNRTNLNWCKNANEWNDFDDDDGDDDDDAEDDDNVDADYGEDDEDEDDVNKNVKALSKNKNITYEGYRGIKEVYDNSSYLADLENCNEPNGNIIINDNNNRISDDDESNSFENEIFVNLQADDKNANCDAQIGAVGLVNTPNASAEIENEETNMVLIDVPITPQRDLVALLTRTTGITMNIENIQLRSFFIAVDEEKSQLYYNSLMSEHVRDLLMDYERGDDKMQNYTSPNTPAKLPNRSNAKENNIDNEQYEKAIPVHGDVVFHNFLSKIQENPGQILRYSRDSLPLLIAPINECIPKCKNCGNELICEIQILATLIPKLRYTNGDQTPIEFGNVLIFTCNRSCWDTPDKWRSEYVLVQEEAPNARSTVEKHWNNNNNNNN